MQKSTKGNKALIYRAGGRLVQVGRLDGAQVSVDFGILTRVSSIVGFRLGKSTSADLHLELDAGVSAWSE